MANARKMVVAVVLGGSALALAACGNLDQGFQAINGMPSGGGGNGPNMGELASNAGSWGYLGAQGRGAGMTGGVPGDSGSAPGFSANGKLLRY